MFNRELLRDSCQPLPMIVIQNKFRSGRSGQHWADTNSEIAQQAEHVTAPPTRDSCGSECVLEDQVPADNPCDELSQSGIPVGISRSGYGNHRSKFGVAKPSKNARQSCKNERKYDRGTSVHG